MSEQTNHPSPTELTAFSLGQLPPDAASRVEEHVIDCHPCCETIVNHSSDDTFVDLLQKVEAESKPVSDIAASKSTRTNEDGVPAPLLDHSRYKIEQLVGRGGMGRVYKARHRMMDRVVALKVIHQEWVRKQEAIDRFRREVKTAASLDHPNIVTAHDAEQADDLHFLVMEYVDGVDLAQTVKNRGPLPVAEACDYIRQAAEGLQYAHKRGMVHRDIKPHNLIVTKENVVKILDFGLASLAPQATTDEPVSEDADGNLTIAGAIMGTPDFISPEQAEDAHKVDGRSDIYSLGMTLYFLLAGRVPFTEGTATEKLKKHAEAEPTSLTTLRDDVPQSLQDVIARMTAKNPAERIQSPQDAAKALLPFVDSNVASQSTSVAIQTNTDRPRRWPIAVFGGSLLVLVALAAWMLPKAFNGPAAVPDEVHASLGELDSYIVSMMNSPHDLVFMNLGEIGSDQSYLTFKPTSGGVQLRLPAFPSNMFDKRQSQYAEKLKSVAKTLSLPTEDKSEFRNGKIAGVNIIVQVTGDPITVAETIRKVVERTFSVQATEECEFTFRNMPSATTGNIGKGPKQVSGDAFVNEHGRGERVYFGELNNWIYLIPSARRAEKQLQKNEDVWYANVNELPTGFASRIRQGESSGTGAPHTPVEYPELRIVNAGTSGTKLGDTTAYNWSLAGRNVGEMHVKLLLTQGGKSEVVQQFKLTGVEENCTSNIRLVLKDESKEGHQRTLNATLSVDKIGMATRNETTNKRTLPITIEAPFSNQLIPIDPRTVRSGETELLHMVSYWKGDLNHGTSIDSMVAATEEGNATFMFVTVDWQPVDETDPDGSDDQRMAAEMLAAEAAAKIPGTPKTNPAGYLMWRVSHKNGDLVQQLKSVVSEAAGIPNDQWESFARSPSASTNAIKGEPLSMVLLSLNPSEEAKANPDVLKDFRLLRGRIPKPNDFHKAMAFSMNSGFYSMLQSSYLKNGPFKVLPNPEAKGGRITGRMPFDSGTLYQGEVHYAVTVDANYNMTITEFQLPNYGVTIRPDEDGTWKRVKTEPVVSLSDQASADMTAETFNAMADKSLNGVNPNTEAARRAANEIAAIAWPVVLSPISKALAQTIVERTKPSHGIRINDRLAQAGRPTESFGWNIQAVHALALAHAGNFDAALKENDLLLLKITIIGGKSRLTSRPCKFLGEARSLKSLQQQLTLHKALILRLADRVVESTDAATEAGRLQPDTSTAADQIAIQRVLAAIAQLPLPESARDQ